MENLSLCSLFLEFYLTEESAKTIAIGTGFTIKANSKSEWFLATNWHCVTGRHPETNNPLNGSCDPEIVKVYFHSKNNIGSWETKKIKLYKDYEKQWLEHPQGRQVDVVLIPIEEDENIHIHNFLDAINTNELIVLPSDACSIIGYPKGLSSGGKFPIWKTGNVASDIDLNWDNKPLFFIDATTREGMSGSPVVCIKEGLVVFKRNNLKSGRFTQFLGVYAGRVDETSEIGRVWKTETLFEILNGYYR